MDIVTLLQADTVAFTAAVFVLSLLVGSFLNVVIYRLPLILDAQWRAQCAELTGQPAAAGEPALTLASPR